MKNEINAEGINPKNHNVLVQIVSLPKDRNKVFQSQQTEEDFRTPPNYLGKVIEVGEKVKSVKKGEYVLFPKISYDTNHILTKGKEIFKTIHEITVVVKSDSTGMKIEDISTTLNRLIVDIQEKEIIKKNDKGVIQTTVEGDPRQRDLLKGVIKAISPEVIKEGYKLNDIVYFSKESGLNVNEIKGKGKFRYIQYGDISFIYDEK